MKGARIRFALALTVAAAACGPPLYIEGPPVSGQIVVETAPPPQQVEAMPVTPYQGAVWTGGYWWWNGARYVWIGGHYERPRAGQGWVPHHWQRGPRGRWHYVPGHWRRM